MIARDGVWRHGCLRDLVAAPKLPALSPSALTTRAIRPPNMATGGYSDIKDADADVIGTFNVPHVRNRFRHCDPLGLEAFLM